MRSGTWCRCAVAASGATMLGEAGGGRRWTAVGRAVTWVVLLAALQRVGVDGGHTDARARSSRNWPRSCQVGRRAGAGAGERYVRGIECANAEKSAVNARRVVAARAAEDLVAALGVIPAEAAVQLGLVADLERRDRFAADLIDERTGLAAGQAAVVGLEVDPEQQLRVGRRRQRLGDLHPLRVSVYLIPGGLRIPGTGHQVQSVLSPPRRSTGRAPGARLRINCSNTGLSAAGSWPA